MSKQQGWSGRLGSKWLLWKVSDDVRFTSTITKAGSSLAINWQPPPANDGSGKPANPGLSCLQRQLSVLPHWLPDRHSWPGAHHPQPSATHQRSLQSITKVRLWTQDAGCISQQDAFDSNLLPGEVHLLFSRREGTSSPSSPMKAQ